MNDKLKEFLKDAFVVVGMMASIVGIAILCLMIGFDEGKAYGDFVSNDRLQNCQQLITRAK